MGYVLREGSKFYFFFWIGKSTLPRFSKLLAVIIVWFFLATLWFLFPEHRIIEITRKR